MCIFCTSTTLASSVVMYHHRATFKKVVLSVTACVVPFMACGTALGAIFLIGVTNSPILHVTPFLVLAISVDDSFLMVHAWNRIGKRNEKAQPRVQMMGQVLAETGPAIVISSLTNMLAFAVGAVSSPSEIHIFCVGNAACIFVDMCYQGRNIHVSKKRLKVFYDGTLGSLPIEFVNYKDALRDELGQDPSAGTLAAFLHWPEYSYYNGFIKQRNAS
ncbi:hypothetical protein TELCIR_05018 [Teladorsagia circumcincta]|uniref:SSD domain-containing protein n=1 Tax=Teladorsagia circumcincta TaxID=45464 RepID=A0A2G9US04_TELCI|nr:hypothetical protein TELCIR_05018 [Teladorsagia circumcincta]